MNYEELIQKAMQGRSVNALAKSWGMEQKTLSRYVKGERMPDFDTAMKMVKEAGVTPGEAFEVLATEERNRKARNFKLQMGFARTGFLAVLAGMAMAVTLFLTTSTAHAANMRVSEQAVAENINYAKLSCPCGNAA